jgi:DNA primase
LQLSTQEHNALLDLILSHAHRGAEVLRKKIIDARGLENLEKLLNAGHVAITPCVRKPGDTEMALMTISEELAKLEAEQGLSAEVAEAAEDLVGLADESVTWRLGQAAQARNLAMRSEHEDKAEYDTAPNGARISREEKSAFDALLGKLNVPKVP